MFGLDNLMDMLFDTAMESISRNERIIKLLKRLNLDPDHPPEDFGGVYQYALVEYGVGKPRPVLEIFRQNEIQQLFREALEHNTPSRLLKHGEAFLAGQALQAELQANQIDVRREFYEFAAVFIEIAKRTRTPAEILTNQKLESLHRQIGTLQERLNRLPTLEGMRTEMARLAAQDSLALPGATSFSAERCQAFALAQQMRGWFETLGYRFETHEVWEADYFEWIINVSVWRSRYIRILVRGVDGEVGLADVNTLKQSIESHKVDEGWLVSDRRIARAARDEVAKPENDHLGCYTLDELLDQDANFSSYLTWLESEIQKRGIDQKYVPLACLKEEVDPDTQQRIGVSRYDDRDGWIEGYIDRWLDDPAKEHISVLGEFGTGKTWFALHYAWQALQRYREAQRRGLDRPRLPLVVPLRDYAKAVSVESLFSEFFFRKHEIPIPGYSAFEQLNRMGKLLLIFDGFDEMAARVDRQQMINNFWELAKVVVPGAKVILTCRTEHFPEAKEGRALLNAELQASTKDLTGETPQFEVLELEKFNDEQIRQVLSHQAQPTTVEQIMGNPELLDLARRPVLTELILEALPDIEAGKPVDMSRVYLYAVRHKMERDIKAERTFTSMADKLYFMCELSWEMLSSDRMSINYREFPDRIRKLFGPAVEEQKDLDHWHYDMMGQTILIRDSEGDYTPAHRSLLEFFVAYKLVASLGVLAEDFTEIAQRQTFIDMTIESESYTWSNYFCRQYNVAGEIQKIAPLREFSSGSFESLSNLNLMHQSKLPKAVLDLAAPMINHHIMNKRLLKLLEKTRDKQLADLEYFGSNLIQLLLSKDLRSLEGKNLSGIIIPETDFSNAYLRQTNLSQTDLRNCLFTKVIGSIISLSFSPDGRFLALSDSNRTIQIWDASTMRIIMLFRGHTDWVRSIDFSPNGQILASGSDDRTVKLWSVSNGQYMVTLQGHKDRVRSVSFSPDGTMIASGSHDQTIKIWSASDGRCINTLKKHSDKVETISFSPDGTMLASGSHDQTIKIWSVNNGQCANTLLGHRNKVETISFSPDGTMLASGSHDQTIKIWSVNNGQCITTLLGHDNWVRSVTFNPSGKTLASASQNQTIKLWSVNDGQCIDTIQGYNNGIQSIIFSPDGKLIASGSENQTVKLWSSSNGQCIATLQGHINWIRSLSFNSDGTVLASSGQDRTIKLWSINGGQCVNTLQGHDKVVRSVRFSPDGKILASGSEDCTIKLWSVNDGQCIYTLRGHHDGVRSVRFHPDGQILASSGNDQTIKLWSISSGQYIDTLRSHKGDVWSLAFSPDGKMLASCGEDQTIKLWSTSTRECIATLRGHSGNIRSIAFNGDGKILASGGDDQTIRLWSVKNGQCLHKLRSHNNRVNSLGFSPNEKILASASNDQTIRLWDMESGDCLLVISDQLCVGMNISGALNLSEAQQTTLKLMGAISKPITYQ